MKISRQSLFDIQCEAKNYMKTFKGENVTAEDLVLAENLIVFGYLKAKSELNIQEQSRTMKENQAIIDSQGDIP